VIEAPLRSSLRGHPFVAAFEPAHVDRLEALAKDVAFARDHVVFHEGDECSDFYLIVSGLVALEIEEPGHTCASRRSTRATSSAGRRC
jgi:CRP-like cAMP-binding protein